MVAGRLSITPLGNLTEPQLRGMDNGLLQCATDIDRFAKIYAPFDKGNLVNSGRIEKIIGGYSIVFGGSNGGVSVPYAKRRHYENLKHPSTLGYLTRAGEQAFKQKTKYFKGL